MKFHEIVKYLRSHGYYLGRQTSSHFHFFNAKGQRVTFSLDHGAHALTPPLVAKLRAKVKRNAGTFTGAGMGIVFGIVGWGGVILVLLHAV